MLRTTLLLLLLLVLQLHASAQRKTIPVGSELVVKELPTWETQYEKRDKIIGKKAFVSTRPLLAGEPGHWSGYITIDGVEYRILDMQAQIITGDVPEKKVEPKDVLKLQAGLKELVSMAPSDFAAIKTDVARKRAYGYAPSFLASYKLSGAEDSTTIIFLDEHVKRWNLETRLNEKQYSSQGIDYMLRTLDLPCGKLEPLPGNDTFSESANIVSRSYVPVDRRKPGSAYRFFSINLSASMYKGKDILLTLTLSNRSNEVDLLGEQMDAATPAPPAPKKELKKMEKDVLSLVEAWKTDFNSIKVGEKINDQYRGNCYKVKGTFEGSEPGDADVCMDTFSKKWSLNVPISTDKYTSTDIDQLLLGMNFPFGKLAKEAAQPDTDNRSYRPQGWQQMTGPYKELYITVLAFKSAGTGKELSLSLLISRSKY
ncbi:MAG: hypothetical protein KF744_04255 [Taibaiella sp.]|nr:hypothetical protein [Taibaiella sp.]